MELEPFGLAADRLVVERIASLIEQAAPYTFFEEPIERFTLRMLVEFSQVVEAETF